MSDYIYHIAHREQWDNRRNGVYKPETFELEDFIHCSTMEQIINVANTFYSNEKDLVLLFINKDKVQPKIVYENLIGGDIMFPHIYGELNDDAVEKVADFKPNSLGKFEFPTS